MADIQVLFYWLSTRDPSKSKTMSSSTPKNCLPKRPLQASGTTNKWDWTSGHPRRPSNQTTSIKNVPSPLESPSEARSSRESWSQPRCSAPSSSEEITSTMSPNTTDTRRDIETSPPTSPLPSQSRKVTSSSSESAVPSPRQSTSTSSRSLPTKLWATCESSLCFSDWWRYDDYEWYWLGQLLVGD